MGSSRFCMLNHSRKWRHQRQYSFFVGPCALKYMNGQLGEKIKIRSSGKKLKRGKKKEENYIKNWEKGLNNASPLQTYFFGGKIESQKSGGGRGNDQNAQYISLWEWTPVLANTGSSSLRSLDMTGYGSSAPIPTLPGESELVSTHLDPIWCRV